MKKLLTLLFVILMIIPLVACGAQSTPPDRSGFDFLVNDDGYYFWLGMTRREVERNFSLEPSVVNHLFDEEKYHLYNEDSLSTGIFIMFDSRGRVSRISSHPPTSGSPTSPPSTYFWYLPNGIGRHSTRKEVESAFGVEYDIFNFSFARDHTPVVRGDDAEFYRISISFFNNDDVAIISLRIVA